MHAKNSYYVDVLLMKMTPNDWNISRSYENDIFLLVICSSDDSSTSILTDESMPWWNRSLNDNCQRFRYRRLNVVLRLVEMLKPNALIVHSITSATSFQFWTIMILFVLKETTTEMLLPVELPNNLYLWGFSYRAWINNVDNSDDLCCDVVTLLN